RNGACVAQVSLDASKAIVPATIAGAEVSYAILKAQPFERKLACCADRALLSDDTARSVLKAAIVSDLSEEQQALRRFDWSGPIPEPTLLEHTPRLCAFVARASA